MTENWEPKVGELCEGINYEGDRVAGRFKRWGDKTLPDCAIVISGCGSALYPTRSSLRPVQDKPEAREWKVGERAIGFLRGDTAKSSPIEGTIRSFTKTWEWIDCAVIWPTDDAGFHCPIESLRHASAPVLDCPECASRTGEHRKGCSLGGCKRFRLGRFCGCCPS